MIKVKTKKLQSGDIIAEHILSEQGQVLLSAGLKLTSKTIQMLISWGIDEVRLREPHDTDEDIAIALQVDSLERTTKVVNKAGVLPTEVKEESNKKYNTDPDSLVAIDEVFAILSGEAGYYQPIQGEISTVVKPETMRRYHDLVTSASGVLNEIANAKHIPIDLLKFLSNNVVDFVALTIGAITYTVKEEKYAVPYSLLAEHSVGVAVTSVKIALLLGLSYDEVRTISLGALIHDIGKLNLSNVVAYRMKKLSKEEEAQYKTHIQLGYNYIKDKKWFPREVALILAQHHENLDGSGYPLRLSKGKIHPYAQIVALADMFLHLIKSDGTTPNINNVRNSLARNAVNRVSKEFVDVFDTYLQDFIYNLNVELEDGRKGEIVYIHQALDKPIIRTTDGEFVDLNSEKTLKVAKYFV